MKHNRLNGFDLVAPVYDMLARLVFGRSLERAQAHYLHQIPNNASVLVLGGGTGWIAEALRAQKPLCEIWFVDASARMIALAQARKNLAGIHFIHGTEMSLPEVQFDAVVTNFYVDLYESPHLAEVIGRVKGQLRSGGLWLVTDFVDTGRPRDCWLLRAMYLFFRLTSRVETSRLPAWREIFEQTGLVPVDHALFQRGFVCTAVFRRR